MEEIRLKPCPFCGGEAHMYGQEIRDYVDGTWAPKSRTEYWVQCFHGLTCDMGMIHAKAFGILGGIHYISPEAAAKAWNKRSTTWQ